MSNVNKSVHVETGTLAGGELNTIPLDKLLPFNDHAFKPYEGRKREALVQSIRENGIVQPIIVRPIKNTDKYEIISGHNRCNAAKLSDLTSIPAIIRVMTDDEAVLLANETNMTQRSFKDWHPSERAKSIYQYHQAIKKQGSRSDLNESTSGDKRQRSDDHARAKTAKAYGLKENIIRLYIELYHLNDKLMERLDKGEFGTTPAQNLSHIKPDGQALVHSILSSDEQMYKVTTKNSKSVRDELKKYTLKSVKKGEMNTITGKIQELLSVESDNFADAPSEKFKIIQIETSEYDRLFSGKTTDEALAEIIVAVETYHDGIYNKDTQTGQPAVVKEATEQ